MLIICPIDSHFNKSIIAMFWLTILKKQIARVTIIKKTIHLTRNFNLVEFF